MKVARCVRRGANGTPNLERGRDHVAYPIFGAGCAPQNPFSVELKAAKAGLQMSPAVLKEELIDLREITMIYADQTAQTLISQRSSVQKKLWKLFKLGFWEKRLTYTN